MTNSSTKLLDKIQAGGMNRASLRQIRKNAEAKLAQGGNKAQDALHVIEAINIAAPTDTQIVFLGFCPGAQLKNRLDQEWKRKGIAEYWQSASETDGQLQRFCELMPGDLICLKKRHAFGKTMQLFGYGRVAQLLSDGHDDDGQPHRILKVDWADQQKVIEVPLLGCNSSVDVRSMETVEKGMPEEFFEWLGIPVICP